MEEDSKDLKDLIDLIYSSSSSKSSSSSNSNSSSSSSSLGEDDTSSSKDDDKSGSKDDDKSKPRIANINKRNPYRVDKVDGVVRTEKKLDKKVIEILDNKYKQLQGLESLRNLDEIQLRDLAKAKLLSPENIAEISALFSDAREIRLAKKLLGKYLSEYSPASVSDKNNLKHLIYLEIIQIRLQEKMNDMNAKTSAIPLQMIDSVHKNLREINDLKLKLGLIGEKREEPKNDAYKALDLLKDKFKRWREENQGTRTLSRPWCGKMIMLKIRTDAWESQCHPLFKDRILANKHLIKLYMEQKITKEDVAKVLECSPDYVLWLLDRWKSNPDYKQIETEIEDESGKVIEDESGKVSEESKEVNMKMSKEKKTRENRCPECEKGFLSCIMTKDGSERWEEHCTSCDYHNIHVNRRKTQSEIDFLERRNNKAPSSLEIEETENDKQGNTEGSPGHREGTGAEGERRADSEDKGSS